MHTSEPPSFPAAPAVEDEPEQTGGRARSESERSFREALRERLAGRRGQDSHPPGRGKTGKPDDPLEAVKRKVYMASLAISAPSMPLLWFALGDGDSFIRFVLPPLAVFCLAVAVALRLDLLPVRAIERVTFAAVATFALLHLVHGLFTTQNLTELRESVDVTTFPTLIVLYVIACLIFDTSEGLRVSLVLYVASFALVMAGVAASGLDALRGSDVAWVAQTYAFMGAVIALLYATSFTKSQLSRERALSEAMSHLALTDQLTGVSNRRKLYLDLQHEIETLPHREVSLSIILFDLDHFKEINDSHGHDRGDAVLREVVESISPLLRKTDYLARWGGEEFILLAPETNLEEASNLAERLRLAVADISPEDEVTASFGISEYAPHETPEAFIKRADEALYVAKASGRNRVENVS